MVGLKTKGQMTCIKTVRGRAVLLGALLYPLRAVKEDVPSFVNDNGAVSLTYRMNGGNYPIHLSARAGGQWRTLARKQVRLNGPALVVSRPGQDKEE